MRPEIRFPAPEATTAEAEPKHSAARQAAEAWFALRPPSSCEPADTPVTVRRKKPRIEAPSEGPPATVQDCEERRAPKVFRIAPTAAEPTLPGGRAGPVGVPAAPAAMPERAGEMQGAPVPSSAPRRRRRHLHGEVSIIRPAQRSTVDDAAEDSPTMEAEPAAPLQAPLPARSARRRGQTDRTDTGPRYPALLARIGELEAEAQRLKALEAAQAVRWIRQAIKTYGLSAQDLGLT